MNWWLAKNVYHIICGEGDHTPQFDEQLRMIEAENELQAFQKARLSGEREQTSFFNDRRMLVQWKFVGVTDVQLLAPLTDGMEIFSTVHEVENEKQFLDTTNLKNRDLLSALTKKSFQQQSVHTLLTSVEKCVGKIV